MKTKPYVTRAGETPAKIARKFEISETMLIEMNPELVGPKPVYVGATIQVPDTSSMFETIVNYVAERLSTQSKGGPVMLPLQDNSILIYLPPSAGMDDVLALALEVEARRQPVKV